MGVSRQQGSTESNQRNRAYPEALAQSFRLLQRYALSLFLLFAVFHCWMMLGSEKIRFQFE